jgi:hypothetical protein
MNVRIPFEFDVEKDFKAYIGIMSFLVRRSLV